MKSTVHPTFIPSKVTCSCGNTFESKSTKEIIHVEVCYKCHPFYTGEHRFLDSKGRVEEFQKKQKVAAQYRARYKETKKFKKDNKQQEGPKSLKELLGEA